VEDHHVDRPEVEREQSPQLTGTNRSIGFFAKAGPTSRSTTRVQRQTPAFAGAGSPHAVQTLPSLTSPWAPAFAGAGLVAIARGQTPDPIPNSAVKTLCAHGTAAQAAEESVAARPKYPNALLPSSRWR
jgi:hypothetical protein